MQLFALLALLLVLGVVVVAVFNVGRDAGYRQGRRARKKAPPVSASQRGRRVYQPAPQGRGCAGLLLAALPLAVATVLAARAVAAAAWR